MNGISPRSKAACWKSRGMRRASTMEPLTCTIQARGWFASLLGNVQSRLPMLILSARMICEDLAAPVLELSANCWQRSKARMWGDWLLSNSQFTRPSA